MFCADCLQSVVLMRMNVLSLAFSDHRYMWRSQPMSRACALSFVWSQVPVIPAFGRPRQDDCKPYKQALKPSPQRVLC